MTANLRPMTLGEILDRAVQIYRGRFLVLAGISALPALAMFGIHAADRAWLHLNSLFHSSDRGSTTAWNFIVYLFYYHISGFLGLLFLPASVKFTSDEIHDGSGTFLSSLQFAKARWKSFLWVAVLKVFAVLVIPEILMTVLLLGTAIIEVAMGTIKSGESVLVFLVLVLLVAGFVLFVWLSACLSLVVPACAMEGTAGIGVFRRSWLLSKGSRFRVFFTWLMVGALGYLMMFVVQFLSWKLAIFFGHGHRLGVAAQHLYIELTSLLYAAVSAFVIPIYAIALTLIYYDQRIRHEGYDIERMMEAAGMNPPTPAHTEASNVATAEAVENQA